MALRVVRITGCPLTVFVGLILCYVGGMDGTVAIQNGSFYINGRITNAGHLSQGLLMNSRMIQAIFDPPKLAGQFATLFSYPDSGKWDPDRNTKEFIGNVTKWKSYNLNAFTVGLQGGQASPSQCEVGNYNFSAWTPDGTLRVDAARRLEGILNAAIDSEMVVIVSLFYWCQCPIFESMAAVDRAVESFMEWAIRGSFQKDIIVEVMNECGISSSFPSVYGLDCDNVWKYLSKLQANGFMVGNSVGGCMGGATPTPSIVAHSDVILLHGNNCNLEDLNAVLLNVTLIDGFDDQPIVFTEGVSVPYIGLLVDVGVSSGFYDQGTNDYSDGFQSPPVDWSVNTDNKKSFFELVKGL